ncbi:MAG: hypothetical protein FWF29_01855, partial [Treponema sp.]|nr:hypothetical protein [Treponema sp.]
PHPMFFDEIINSNAGIYMDDKYGPFVVDLSDRLATSDARLLAQWYHGSGAFGPPRQYGALYFKNLPSVSETGDESILRSYMSYFTLELFGRTTRFRSQ